MFYVICSSRSRSIVVQNNKIKNLGLPRNADTIQSVYYARLLDYIYIWLFRNRLLFKRRCLKHYYFVVLDFLIMNDCQIICIINYLYQFFISLYMKAYAAEIILFAYKFFCTICFL